MKGHALTKLIALAVSTASVVVGAPLAGNWFASQSQNGGGAAAPSRSAAPSVTVQPHDDDFVGVLLPKQMANLTPQTEAKIIQILRNVGEAVQKNDVIVSFDQRDRQHELAIAKARLEAAQAEAASASVEVAFANKRVLRRDIEINVDGRQIALVSGEEATQAQSQVETAKARQLAAQSHIAEQRARVEQLDLALHESEIRAPFAGIVSSLNFEPGATVHPGDVVARVVGGGGVRVRIAVPEEEAFRLTARSARMLFEGRTLVATIDQVPPEPEPSSRAFVIEGIVPALDGSSEDELRAVIGHKVRASLVP